MSSPKFTTRENKEAFEKLIGLAGNDADAKEWIEKDAAKNANLLQTRLDTQLALDEAQSIELKMRRIEKWINFQDPAAVRFFETVRKQHREALSNYEAKAQAYELEGGYGGFKASHHLLEQQIREAREGTV